MSNVEEYLEKMEIPRDYSGPRLVVVLRDMQLEAKAMYAKYTEIAIGKDAKLTGPIGTFAQE